MATRCSWRIEQHCVLARPLREAAVRSDPRLCPGRSGLHPPYEMVARGGLPQSSVAQIIEAARQTPDRFSIGSPGRGSAPQVLGAAMMKSAGVRFVEIPYKGTQAQYADLLAGRIDVQLRIRSAAPRRNGKDQGDRRRLPAAQQPRARHSDHGRKRDARIGDGGGLGLFVPAATSPDIVERLRDELRQSIPALTERFAASGGEPMQLTRAETDAFVRRELERWMTVIREAGICAD